MRRVHGLVASLACLTMVFACGDSGGVADGDSTTGRSDAGGSMGGGDGGTAADEDSGLAGADAGVDAGATTDAAASGDAGSDGGGTSAAPIEGTASCADLPGSLTDDYEGVYKGVCVTVDWTNDICSLAETTCPNGLFFDWKDEAGGYFNLKVEIGGDVILSTKGTVNKAPMGVQGVPASISDLPEGEDVIAQIEDKDGARFSIQFRRDGNLITIDAILKLAI